MRTVLVVAAVVLAASAAPAQIVTDVVGKPPVIVARHVTPFSSTPPVVADVWPRADAVVHLRIARTLGAGPWPLGSDRVLCTEHEATVLEVLKPHGADGPTGERFHLLQELAGVWQDAGKTFRGQNAPFDEGTELIAFLTWHAATSRFTIWSDPLTVRDGRVYRLSNRSEEVLFLDVPAGTRVEDFLAKVRALAKQRQ